MTISEFENFLKLQPSEKVEKISKLYNGERQKKLKMNRDYYDGKHWSIEGKKAKQTRSGQNVFGSDKVSRIKKDDVFELQTKTDSVAVEEGFLKKNNHIKKIIQAYENFVPGNEKQKSKIIISNEEELQPNQIAEIEDTIAEVFSNLDDFIRKQTPKAILNTVAVTKIKQSEIDNSFYLDTVDAYDIFPIYEGDNIVGILDIKTYKKNDKEEGYMLKAFIKTDRDQWSYFKFKDGELKISEKLEGYTSESPSMNYNPYVLGINKNHAFHNFDSKNLEDSEIFEMIEGNDEINAYETLGYIKNLLFATITPEIDYDNAKKAGIDDPHSDPAIGQALEDLQITSLSLNNLPLKYPKGQEFSKQFYDHIEKKTNQLYSDAGIPEIFVKGTNANISEKTAYSMLTVLISSVAGKRMMFIKHVKEILNIICKAKNIIAKDEEIEIEIQFPDVISLTQKEIIDILLQSSGNVLPNEYTREKILQMIGNGEDVERVNELVETEDTELNNILSQARQQQEDEDEQNLINEANQRADEIEDSL